MKLIYTILTVALLFFITVKPFAQNKVSITGGSCEGTVLQAHTQGSKLVQLHWKASSTPVDTSTIAVPYFKDGTTVAGGNDNGVGPNQLSFPTDVFVDNNGNIFISDNGNNRIQKWAPGAREGITVAGGNGHGSAPNQLNFPVGLFINSEGALYIADVYNNRIQKWLPNAVKGITVAGGNGQGDSTNQLYRPYDVYLDSANNLYIADEGNYRVQEWPEGAMEGITVAGGNGSGSAANQLEAPQFVTIDKLHNVFVADLTNNRVQKWAPGAKEGVTVAGNAEGDFGSADSLLNDAKGIFLDKDGKLYVSDLFNNRIQLFLPDSAHETLPDSNYTDKTGGVYQATASFLKGPDALSNKIAVTSLPVFTHITGQKRNLCGGGNFIYSVPAIDGASDYRWVAPHGSTIVSGQGTPFVTINIPATGFAYGIISVNAKNNCGRGKTLFDTISTKPVRPDSIKGPSYVKLDGTVVFHTTLMNGINYQWEVPSGVIILSGQGTSRISVKWHHIESDYVYVRAQACAAASSQRLLVSLKPNNKSSDVGSDLNSFSKNSTLGIRVFPNPSNNIAFLQIQSINSTILSIKLTDITGRVLQTKQVNAIKGSTETQINISVYPAGIYLLKMNDVTGKIVTVKLIKQ